MPSGTDIEVKRLKPRERTLRQLFLHSGNMCASPGCPQLLIDLSGVFVGEVCHIEAAEEGGQRFNKLMSNDARRGFPNLILLCSIHHKKTNDVEAYPVERLRSMKAAHEAKFADPAARILDRLTDWTQGDEPTQPTRLDHLANLLGWELDADARSQYLAGLEKFVERFRGVPKNLRLFVGSVASRMNRMRTRPSIVRKGAAGEWSILLSDLTGAFQRSEDEILDRVVELERYDLGGATEWLSDGHARAVLLADIDRKTELSWPDLARFCVAAGLLIETLTEDLDFACLD